MSCENFTICQGRTALVCSAAGVMPKAWRLEMFSVEPSALSAGLQFYVAPHHDATPSWSLSPLTLLPGQTFCIRPELDLTGLICPDSFLFSCSAAIRTVRVAPSQGLTGAKYGVYGREKCHGTDYRHCRTVLGWRL